ncbi:MAG: glycosyltransferase [Chitinophagaceae bacterium]
MNNVEICAAKMERKNILWLTSWYPNKEDLFDGDFIQRHARAAAIENNITVVFVKPSMLYNEIVHQGCEGVDEIIIYFPMAKGRLKQVQVLFRWRKAFLHAVESYIKAKGLPHLVHVHIPWKAGLIALYLNKRYDLSFIVTEHWGIYNDYVKDNFDQRWGIIQRLTKKICRESLALISVSGYLGRAMQERGLTKSFSVIPNVVDNRVFYFLERSKGPVFTFVHVSNMEDLKNVAGIINAFHILLQSGARSARLVLVGKYTETLQQQAASLDLLESGIFFKGEISYADVAKEMQTGDCFVMNSHIENAPCVISEALCCGIPVVATNVGGVPEMIDGSNGLLLPPDNTLLLAEAMERMIENQDFYHRKEIAATACLRYGLVAVARQFQILYFNA